MNLTWQKIAQSKEEIYFPANGITTLQVSNKIICLTRYNNTLFAFASTCPHASGNMAEGFIDAIGNVVCPVHRYKFNLATGRNTAGEEYALPIYPVEIRPEGVFIGLRKSHFL